LGRICTDFLKEKIEKAANVLLTAFFIFNPRPKP